MTSFLVNKSREGTTDVIRNNHSQKRPRWSLKLHLPITYVFAQFFWIYSVRTKFKFSMFQSEETYNNSKNCELWSYADGFGQGLDGEPSRIEDLVKVGLAGIVLSVFGRRKFGVLEETVNNKRLTNKTSDNPFCIDYKTVWIIEKADLIFTGSFNTWNLKYVKSDCSNVTHDRNDWILAW